MNAISIIVNWSGPNNFDDASKLEKQGIYLVYGRNRKGTEPDNYKLLYCGISEREILEKEFMNIGMMAIVIKIMNGGLVVRCFPEEKERLFWRWQNGL